MISVDMFLQMPDLRDLKVIAGQSGLEREIKAVTVMDAPDSHKWLKGDELVMTSGYMFGGDPLLLEQFIGNLIKARSAGFCYKKECFINIIPDSVINAAEQYRLPIIEIPYELVWPDVISVFYEMLYDISENTFKPIEPEYIEQIFSAGCKGSRQLIDKLTQLFQVPLAVLHKNKKVLIDNGLPGVKLISKTLEDSQLFPESMGAEVIDAGKYHLTVCNIPFLRQSKEYLAVLSQNRNFLTEIHKLFRLLSSMATKESAMSRDREQIYREFMLGFISGKVTQEDIQRFEEFRGTDETVYTGVLLIHSSDYTVVYQLLREALKSARLQKKGNAASYYVDDAAKQEAVVMLELYAGKNPDAPCKWRHILYEELEQSIREERDSYISMGRFSPSLEDILLSYREAREAYTVGRVLWDDRRCFSYSMISVYSVLRKSNLSQIDLSDIEFLNNHRNALSFDAIQTLEVYIECGGYKKAAQKLFVHENTLRYRIQKIGDLLDMDMEDPLVTQTLIIQLKLWKSIK